MGKINRRNFFSGAAAGLVGLGLSKNAAASTGRGITGLAAASESAEEAKIARYNPFGKMGINTSDIIFGAGNISSQHVVRYAYDLGINVFDTAEGYMNGRSEELVGKALKDVRKKAVIITKLGFHRPDEKREKKAVIERMNACLKRLQTDYVDIAYFHAINDMELVKNDEVRGAFEQLKKEGKIRFTGFSTHDAKVTLKEALKPEFKDFVEAVLFMYSHMDGKEIEPLISKIRARGIGTVAMKVLAGGKQGKLKSFITKDVGYPEAATRWVLSNKDVDCAVLSMATFAHVEEYVKISGKKLSHGDLAVLKRYSKEVDNLYCRVSCNQCESSCPQNVAISNVMRYGMYFEDYGHEKRAIEHYAGLNKKQKPLGCNTCSGYCNTACPHGLQVKDKLLTIHENLTV